MKRLLSILLSAVLLMSVASVALAESAYTPGTYTASAKGFGGDVVVSVTVDESKIVDCVVTGDAETPELGGVALANLPAAIAAAGSADVDAVSGATITSNAIFTALNEALAQATGAEREVKMAPGTYTASAYGFKAVVPVTVTVTVDETSILSIESDGGLDTITMVRIVNNDLIPRILEYQSVGIDAICGATATSSAVFSATAQCLKEALAAGGSDPAAISAFYTPEPKVEAEKTIDVDVVVVGLGAAGIAACTSAAEAQAAAGQEVSVLAIEKAGYIGGTGAFTGEPMGVNAPRYKAAFNNGEDYMDMDALLTAWEGYTEGDAKMEVVEAFLKDSGETIDWLFFDHGFLFNNPLTGFSPEDVYRCKYQYVHAGNKEEGRDYGVPVESDRDTMVEGYYAHITKDYVDLGGEYLLETEGYGLLYDEATNAIKGVKARQHDGTELIINAKSVILASGGFAGSAELEAKYLSQNPYFDNFGSAQWTLYGMTQNDGKMLEAAVEIGAGTYNVGMVPMVHQVTSNIVLHDYPVNANETGSGTWSLNDVPNALALCSDVAWVDPDGERFDAEGALFCWWKAGPSYWSIWSQDMLDNVAENGFSTRIASNARGTQGGVPGNMPIPELYEILDKLVAQGYMVKADTFAELGEKMGADPEVFAATMEAYVGYCETGVDEQFGKAAEKLIAPGEGPYYAIKGYSAAFATNGALDINERYEVLKSDGVTPINGLWGTGNEAASVLYTMKKPYVTYGGCALGFAYTSGRISGIYAVEYANAKE